MLFKDQLSISINCQSASILIIRPYTDASTSQTDKACTA
jgi:hypothetical protein